MFILKRSDGKIVAKSGSKNSYTTDIFKAELFNTKEIADNNRCPENEYIVDIGYNAILGN